VNTEHPTGKQLSVVISTRDRGSQVVSAAESVLADHDCELELIVVDQSGSPATAEAVGRSPLVADPRFSYRRTSTTGLSRGRNEGTRQARGEIVAFTDDDCVVTPQWPSRIVEQFQHMPDLALWFGSIVAPADQGDGWIFEFRPRTEGFLRPPFDFTRSPGSGANYAVRRSLFGRIGLLDELLGAGEFLASSEEIDFAYRAWRADRPIYVGSEPAVIHHGGRRGREVQHSIAGYLRGIGGMAMKHIRAGDSHALRGLLRECGRHGREGVRQLLQGRRPVSYRALLTLLRGAAGSFRYDVDPQRRLYRPRGAASPAAVGAHDSAFGIESCR
jgi:GT2 family glycosyltransferase